MIGTQPQLSAQQKFIRYWLPVLVYAGFILYLSSLPFRIRQPPFPYYDKVFHFMEYGIYAGLWYRALRRTTRLSLHGHGTTGIATFLICSLFGIGDELFQSFMPYRVSDMYDVAADASGAFVASALAVLKGWVTRS